LARAFRWEYSYQRLKLAQLLGQLGVFLTQEARAPERDVAHDVPAVRGEREPVLVRHRALELDLRGQPVG
jgi:hypothetical protein